MAAPAPVPVAAPVPAATGVLARVEAVGIAEELHAAQVELASALEASTGLLEASTGLLEAIPVAVSEQDVEVLVQTGTEMVHGQSVTVRVVDAETV